MEANNRSLELLAIIEAGSVQIIKVRVLEGSQCRYASVRIQRNQSCQQVHLQLVECGCVLDHGHAAELGEGRFEVTKFESIGPVVLIWCTKDLENFEDLVNFGVTHEKRPTLHHFCEDAPS